MEPAVIRDDMVDGLVSAPKRVLSDDAVAEAMRSVPRHRFVEDERRAYDDREHVFRDTRVLAPRTVARVFEALAVEAGNAVLIVGAGVGYTAAVAAELTGEANVHAVDISRPVVHGARTRLEEAGYGGVLVDCRDGATGLPAYAPYDRILLEAAVVEPPRSLCDQLSDDGRLVYPRGLGVQTLTSVSTTHPVDEHGYVSFDPLLIAGEESGAMERNRTSREDREHAARRGTRRPGWEQTWIEWDGR